MIARIEKTEYTDYIGKLIRYKIYGEGK
jgi:hypothetical protein